jgi:hypothetical protein
LFFLPRVSRFASSSPANDLIPPALHNNGAQAPDQVSLLAVKNRIGNLSERPGIQSERRKPGMTYLFLPALFSLAVIASVWIRDAIEGN